MIQYGLGDSICLTLLEVCEDIDTKPVCCPGGGGGGGGGSLWPVVTSNRSRNPEHNEHIYLW